MEHKLYVGNLAPTANEYLPHANKSNLVVQTFNSSPPPEGIT